MRHTQRTGTEWSQRWCRIPNTRLSRSELVAQRHLMFGHFLSVWLKYDVTGLFFTDSSFICKPSIILFRKLQTFAFLIQSCSLRKTNRCPRTTSKKQTVRAANCPCNPHKKEFLLKKKTKERFSRGHVDLLSHLQQTENPDLLPGGRKKEIKTVDIQ